MKFVSLAFVVATSVSAQVSAPLLGWMPEETQVRRISGLPAAATLGSVADTGRSLANITVSPSQNYVLASDVGTGEVLLIIPSASTGVSVTALNTPATPDRIAVSPLGSSAAVWYSTAGQIEIISGLPAKARVRQIDASFLTGGVSAITVSDDGQWIAAASSGSVYQWGPDGVPRVVYGGSDAAALAFFASADNLAIATSTQLLSMAGSAMSVLYQGSFIPAGLATSFDNQKIVLADRSGTIYSVDAAAQTASSLDCQCTPDGVFGMGGAVFRLTNSTASAIKLVDATANEILSVPRAIRKARRSVRPAQSAGTLPTLTINLNPTPTGYLQQPAMTITASSTSSSEIDGNVTLTFVSHSGGTDQTIQFSAGTTVNFTIPAGSTQANFSGAPSVSFSTGTVAGTITLSANVTAPTAASAVATQTVTTEPSTAVITGVKFAPSSGGVTVSVTGYSSTDEVISAGFLFALSNNATLTPNDIGVGVSSEFQSYYATTGSYATGSEFTLSVPFAITGNVSDIVGVSVSLINTKGASTPVRSQ